MLHFQIKKLEKRLMAMPQGWTCNKLLDQVVTVFARVVDRLGSSRVLLLAMLRRNERIYERRRIMGQKMGRNESPFNTK